MDYLGWFCFPGLGVQYSLQEYINHFGEKLKGCPLQVRAGLFHRTTDFFPRVMGACSKMFKSSYIIKDVQYPQIFRSYVIEFGVSANYILEPRQSHSTLILHPTAVHDGPKCSPGLEFPGWVGPGFALRPRYPFETLYMWKLRIPSVPTLFEWYEALSVVDLVRRRIDKYNLHQTYVLCLIAQPLLSSASDFSIIQEELCVPSAHIRAQ